LLSIFSSIPFPRGVGTVVLTGINFHFENGSWLKMKFESDEMDLSTSIKGAYDKLPPM